MSGVEAIRDARPADLPEILAMVRELAAYEREPDAVVFDPDEFARHLFGEDAVARAIIAEYEDAAVGIALYFRTFSTWLGRDGIWLEDLGSTNGTYVNGIKVSEPRRLSQGDVIRIGETDLRFER